MRRARRALVRVKVESIACSWARSVCLSVGFEERDGEGVL